MYLITYSCQLLGKVEASGQEGILRCEASVRCKAACSFLVKRGVPYIAQDPSQVDWVDQVLFDITVQTSTRGTVHSS